MHRSDVSIEITLLGESKATNRANEFRLDAALVVPVSPERREHGVDLVAIGAKVLFLLPFPFLRNGILRRLLDRQRLIAALEHPVTGQRGLQRERSLAIGAQVLSRSPTILPLIVIQRHGP